MIQEEASPYFGNDYLLNSPTPSLTGLCNPPGSRADCINVVLLALLHIPETSWLIEWHMKHRCDQGRCARDCLVGRLHGTLERVISALAALDTLAIRRAICGALRLRVRGAHDPPPPPPPPPGVLAALLRMCGADPTLVRYTLTCPDPAHRVRTLENPTRFPLVHVDATTPCAGLDAAAAWHAHASGMTTLTQRLASRPCPLPGCTQVCAAQVALEQPLPRVLVVRCERWTRDPQSPYGATRAPEEQVLLPKFLQGVPGLSRPRDPRHDPERYEHVAVLVHDTQSEDPREGRWVFILVEGECRVVFEDEKVRVLTEDDIQRYNPNVNWVGVVYVLRAYQEA